MVFKYPMSDEKLNTNEALGDFFNLYIRVVFSSAVKIKYALIGFLNN